MENTLENKAKFLAQHWGQKIVHFNEMNLVTRDEEVPKKIDPVYIAYPCIKYAVIELKPLSLITDEDLGNMARFYNRTATNVYIHDDQLTFDYYHADEIHSAAVELDSGYCIDYLRSNGYTMEWMGLTVSKLKEYGWIKLKSFKP